MNYIAWAGSLVLVSAALVMLSEGSPELATAIAVLLLVGVLYSHMSKLRLRYQF